MEKQEKNGTARDQPISNTSEESSSELILLPTEAIEHKPTRIFTGSILDKSSSKVANAFNTVFGGGGGGSGDDQDDKSDAPISEQRSTYAMRSRRRQEFKDKCAVVQQGVITVLILYLSIIIAATFTWISYNVWFIP